MKLIDLNIQNLFISNYLVPGTTEVLQTSCPDFGPNIPLTILSRNKLRDYVTE